MDESSTVGIGLVELSNRRVVDGWSCRIVESSNGGVVELSNCRIVDSWNSGVVDSSSGGLVELSIRRIVKWSRP